MSLLANNSPLGIPVLVDREEFVLRAEDDGEHFVNVGAENIEAKWSLQVLSGRRSEVLDAGASH